MAGLKVVSVKVHSDGNLDLDDLRTKAEKHRDNLAAFMVRRHRFYRHCWHSFSYADHLSFHFRCLRIRCTGGMLRDTLHMCYL